MPEPTNLKDFASRALSAIRNPGRANAPPRAWHNRIIGFDDSPMAEFVWPPLTTLRQPLQEVGRKCVEMVLTLIDGKELPERHVLLKPELVLRATA